MKPMIFSSGKAFEQLEKHGQVASARSKPRKEEEVWIRKTRTGEKQFDAEIYDVEEVCWDTEKQLYQALHDNDLISGFSSVHEWRKEIEKLNGGNIPNPLYIHHVVKEDHNLLKTGDKALKTSEA